MNYTNKFLIVLAIFLAGCLLVGGSFAADVSTQDVATNDNHVAIKQSDLEKFTLDDSSNLGEFNGIREKVKLNVSVENTVYGDGLNVTAIFNRSVSGQVHISIDGKYVATMRMHNEDKKTVEIPYKLLRDYDVNMPGLHTVSLYYPGYWLRFSHAQSPTEYFFIARDTINTVNITVTNTYIPYGSSTKVRVDVDKNPKVNGSVALLIDGKFYGIKELDYIDYYGDINNSATFNVRGLSAGAHNISAIYLGNRLYAPKFSDVNKSVFVWKVPYYRDVVLKLNTTVINYGESAKATVYLKDLRFIKGNVTLFINGKPYDTKKLFGNRAEFDLTDLNASYPSFFSYPYTITAVFNGENYLSKASNPAFLTVNKIVPDMDITVTEDLIYGDNATAKVTLPEDVTGKVVFHFNGEYIPVDIENGVATLELGKLGAGDYKISASYWGDNNYWGNYDYTNFTVAKAVPDVSVNVTPEVIIFHDDVIVTATVPNDATGTVTFTIGKKSITANVVNGIATATFKGLGAGKYNVTATYNGDNNYTENNDMDTFKINKINTVLEPVVGVGGVYYEGDKVKVLVLVGYNNEDGVFVVAKDATGYVKVNVDGIILTAKVVNGRAEVVFEKRLHAGQYTAKVWYSGDNNYTSAEDNGYFYVDKKPVKPPVKPHAKHNNTLPATGNPLLVLLVALAALGVGSLRRKF